MTVHGGKIKNTPVLGGRLYKFSLTFPVIWFAKINLSLSPFKKETILEQCLFGMTWIITHCTSLSIGFQSENGGSIAVGINTQIL